MKGRSPKRKSILEAIAVICLFLGYLGFQQIQESHVNRFNAAQLVQANRNATKELKTNALSIQGLLSQATDAVSEHNVAAEVGVLLDQYMEQWRQEIISDEQSQSTAQQSGSSTPPWWSTSFFFAAAGGR